METNEMIYMVSLVLGALLVTVFSVQLRKIAEDALDRMSDATRDNLEYAFNRYIQDVRDYVDKTPTKLDDTALDTFIQFWESLDDEDKEALKAQTKHNLTSK